MKSYNTGVDVLGADPETNRALLVRIRNSGELARGQGALASFATAIAPATIEAQVYKEARVKLEAALRDKNVDADVSIVEPKGWVSAGNGHIWTDIGFAVGGAGVLAALIYLFRGRK